MISYDEDVAILTSIAASPVTGNDMPILQVLFVLSNYPSRTVAKHRNHHGSTAANSIAKSRMRALVAKVRAPLALVAVNAAVIATITRAAAFAPQAAHVQTL
jgi:hypothetical protein